MIGRDVGQQKDEPAEDSAFILRMVMDYQKRGNLIGFSECVNPVYEMRPAPRGYKFLCDFTHKDGHVFASEGGDTRREALERTIAVVVASQMEGAKVTQE